MCMCVAGQDEQELAPDHVTEDAGVETAEAGL